MSALAQVSLLEQVSLFDKGFFYHEDFDLCLRLRGASFRLRYVPRPTVLHRMGATSRESPAFWQYHMERSSVCYYAKHGRGRFWSPVPFRVGSGLKRIARLIMRGDILTAAAYRRGIQDSLSGLRSSVKSK